MDRPPSNLKLIPRKRKLEHLKFSSGESSLKLPSVFTRLPSDTEVKKTDDPPKSVCDEMDFVELPNVIMIAFDSLIQRHSYATCRLSNDSSEVLVFVLKSMLNHTLWTKSSNSQQNRIASSVASTDFHIELERSCLNGQLKMIQLHGLDGEEDVAVFRMSDYILGVKAAFNEQDNHMMDLSYLFLDSLPSFQATHVTGVDLLKMMKYTNEKRETPVLFSEKWVIELVSRKVLLPRYRSGSTNYLMSSFWFTLPMLSDSAKQLAEGRRRLINRLTRAPNNEIKRTTLETSTTGGFMGTFHVRDLLAKRAVFIKETANGQFVKLT